MLFWEGHDVIIGTTGKIKKTKMYRKGINLKLPEFIWKEPIVLKYINILMYQSDTVILNITNSTL